MTIKMLIRITVIVGHSYWILFILLIGQNKRDTEVFVFVSVIIIIIRIAKKERARSERKERERERGIRKREICETEKYLTSYIFSSVSRKVITHLGEGGTRAGPRWKCWNSKVSNTRVRFIGTVYQLRFPTEILWAMMVQETCRRWGYNLTEEWDMSHKDEAIARPVDQSTSPPYFFLSPGTPNNFIVFGINRTIYTHIKFQYRKI